MKTTLAAVGLAAVLAQPAAAVTFPSLTTIYVGAGVTDDGGGANLGLATTFICTNVSGTSASIRILVLNAGGNVEGQVTSVIPHGGTNTVSTYSTTTFFENFITTGSVEHGAVNIESTQSAVFCTAAIVNAATDGEGIPLHLVRVNPHPGTVE